VTVSTLPRLRAGAHLGGVHALIEARRRWFVGLALSLVAVAAVGAFFLFHHGGGAGGLVGRPTAGQSGAQIENAGISDRFLRFSDLPRRAPQGQLPRDVRAASRVVAQVEGATIFAAPTHDGYWEMFARAKDGWWGGGVPWRVTIQRHPQPPSGWRVGGGGLYTQSGYPAIVSGSTIVARGAKLLVVYADGARERIRVFWVSKPIGAGFYYHVIPTLHRVRARRVVALELIRGGDVVARQVLPIANLSVSRSK